MTNSSPPTISAKRQMNGLAVYIMSLATMVGLYSIYLKYAVPAIEGPPQIVRRATATPISDLPSPQQNKSHLIPLLPADAWELGQCKTLLTSSGTILFQEIEQLENGRLKVKPFTLLSGVSIDNLPDPKLEKETPTVLRTIDGAILNFDKPLSDVMQGDGKMNGARLIGIVDIYRPASKPNVDDQLHVLTSNVQLDKQRIFTLETVAFAFGPHRGRGRNLIIDLEHEVDDTSDRSVDFSDIKGVRRFELAFLESLQIEPSKVSTNPTNTIANAKKNKLFSNSRSPLKISCDGPFTFDMETQTAIFEKRVLAEQVDAYGDNIQCERLTLTFDTQKKMRGNTKLATDDDDLKLKRFLAEGTPAKVTSNSKAAVITGLRLSYNVETNKIHGQSSASQPMSLVTPDYQIATRELFYDVPENEGEVGPVVANGPGHLLRLGKKPESEFFVRWNESLKTEANPNSPDMQRIIVVGQAFAKIGLDTNIRADQLDLIVREVPKVIVDENNKPKQSKEQIPVKLIASGNVKIVSPKISGGAKNLTASWEGTEKFSSTTPPQHIVAYRGKLVQQLNRQDTFREVTPDRNLPVKSQTSVQQSLFQSVNGKPDDSHSFLVQASAESSVATPPAPKKKLNFSGDNVTVKLAGHSKDTEVRDLLVDGNVVVTTQQKNFGTMKIAGGSMRLIPQNGEENYRVQVSSAPGSPAKVQTKDFDLAGKIINLDQAANKIWVEGAGNMSIIPTKSRSATSTSSIASKLSKLEKMDAQWQGGMVFDGSKIYFERDVNLNFSQIDKAGLRTITEASTQGLSIALKQSVDLKQLSKEDLGNSSVDPIFDIQELIFTNRIANSQQIFTLASNVIPTSNVPSPNVSVKSKTFEANGTPFEQQIINVPYLKINADSGAISAKGPGSIATYQLGDNSKQKSNPFSKFAGSSNPSNKKKSVLSLVRVNFDRTLEANSDSKEMIVSGNLRTVYSPVANWNVMMNPDNHRPTPDSVHLTCEQLHIAQWSRRSSTKPTSEMIAKGNAQIQSNVFQATADRVSYNEASDILTIEGTPRNDANLWHKQSPNDRNPTHVVAEKITYRLKDQATELQGIKKSGFNQN